MTLHYRWLTQELIAKLPAWCSPRTVDVDQVRDKDTRSFLISDENEQIVGLAEWFTAKAHHGEYYLDIRVNPAWRRKGLGTEIFKLASSLRNQNIPFTARGLLHSETVLFSYSLGAHTKQICPPANASMKFKNELRSCDGVKQLDSDMKTAFQDAYLSMYEWTHASWSPVSGVHQQTIRRSALEDIDLKATSIHLDEHKKIDAFVAVFQDGDAPLLVGETTIKDLPNGERIIEGCLRRTLDILNQRGTTEVTMDGHVTDPHWFPNWIKLSPYGEWFQLLTIPASNEPSTIVPAP